MGEEEKRICGLNMAAEDEDPDFCQEPVHETTDRCIFHADASAKESEKHKELFWEKLSKRIEDATDIIDFRRFKFPEEIWEFWGETVNKGIDLSRAEFTERVHFDDTKFQEEVSFNGAKFGKRLDFRIVKFGGEVSFVDAVFDREVAFGGVIFVGPAHFDFATFSELAYFQQVKFWGNVYFRRVTFGGYTTFDLIENRKTADFSETNFKDEALFERIYRYIDAPEDWSFFRPKTGDIKPLDQNAVINLTDVRFLEKGRITFRDNNVSRYSFAGTSGLKDERTVSFINVDWGRPGDIKRKMIGDEDPVSELIERRRILRKYAKVAACGLKKLNSHFNKLNENTQQWLFEVFGDCRCKQHLPRTKEDIKKIKNYDKNILNKELSNACEYSAEVYRRLRLNYEVRLGYEEASDFHIGQMEMMLLNPSTAKPKKFFLRWYKRLSNFGESVELPLLWFLLLWAIFSALWLAEPFIAPIEDIFSWRVTGPWELWGLLDTVSAVDVSSYFVKTTLFALKAFFTFSIDTGIPGQTLALLQKVFGAGIITLFILALRRAFRR